MLLNCSISNIQIVNLNEYPANENHEKDLNFVYKPNIISDISSLRVVLSVYYIAINCINNFNLLLL